jgi:predicted aconitase
MHLTNWEERALDGDFGEALATSYRVLLSLGEFLGADRLIPIVSAHISGVNYSNIGEEGLNFIQSLSRDGRVRVKTTLNPCGIELATPHSMKPPPDFVERQVRIVECYKKMGVSATMSCVPYEFDNRPRKGSHAAWAESSASLYGNSILGIMTNRESAITSVAAAIAGKTPNAGMHLEENRRPGIIVDVQARLESVTDYGLLGLFSGRLTGLPIGFVGLGKINRLQGKALGAGVGTSGSSPMFMLLERRISGLEVVNFSQRDLEEIRSKNREVSNPETILLGCPFYTLQEVRRLSEKLRSRRMLKPTYLHLSSSVYRVADKNGLIKQIERSGVKVLRDLCPSLTPTGSWNGWSRVATDSAKGSYYMRSALRYQVEVEDIDYLLREYSA